ncbi:MAG: glycerophosphodiester phosphodiesterase family protein [Calditrichota bacterium]
MNVNIEASPFLLIAHRGGLFYRPENTRAAFSHIVERGVRWIETDVRMTHDGVLVLCHDDRVTMPSGDLEAVRDLTYRQLRSHDAGGGETIMRLKDLLDEFGGRLSFDLEIKELDVVPKTVDLLREYRLERRVFLSSFMPEAMQEARELAPEIDRGLLVDRVVGRLVGGKGAVNAAILLDCRYFLPHLNRISASWVQTAHDAGMKVIPWTVNRPEDMKRMISLGVDGVISDRPDNLL